MYACLTKYIISFISFTVFVAWPQAACGQSNDLEFKQVIHGGVGVKAGVINTGLLKKDGREFDADPGSCIGVFFDFPLARRLMLGTAIDFYHIRVLNVQELMADISLALKPIIYRPNVDLAIKPYIALGFGHLGNWEILEDTYYMSIKVFTAVAFFSEEHKHAWLLEAGYTAFPVGGNSQFDTSIDPSLTVRVGIMY